MAPPLHGPWFCISFPFFCFFRKVLTPHFPSTPPLVAHVSAQGEAAKRRNRGSGGAQQDPAAERAGGHLDFRFAARLALHLTS